MSRPERRSSGVAPRLQGYLAGFDTPVLLSIIVLAVTLIGLFGSNAMEIRVTTGLVYLVVVVGIYIFIGNSGVVSFGHISYMAIGAYAAALMTIPAIRKEALLPDLPSAIQQIEIPIVAAAIIAGLLTAMFAFITGIPIMRLSGIAASIALFSLLLVVNTVISQTESITRGRQTMLGIPLETSLVGTLGWAVVAIFAAFAFQQTRAGLRLRASREDEFGAKAAAISIPRERLVALVLSAFVVAVGGTLYGGLLGSLSPDAFYIQLTFTTIVMLVVGGMRSLSGAVVGTAVVFVVSELLRRAEQGFDVGPLAVPARPGVQLLGVSVLGLAILIFRPSGITGGHEITINRILAPLRRRRSPAPRGKQDQAVEAPVADSSKP